MINYKPEDIDEIIGHKQLFEKDSIFYNLIHKKILTNLILYGPSGIGKTTILNILLKKMDVNYLDFNPLVDKKDKLVGFINGISSLPKIVLINEIHNMNKDKQDILLEGLENKEIYLFASTNLNPYFNLNNALISRCFLITLNDISSKDLFDALKNILKKYDVDVNNYIDIIKLIVKYLSNDIRKAIDTLFLIINLYGNKKIINLEDIETFIKNNQTFISTSSNEFTDLKSAFHKSLRGSDVNASLYYLYLLMKAGDYKAIYRRLVAATYEDVGLANPNLTIRVMNAIKACEFLGEKESFEILAFVTIDIALSPKSNSAYVALNNVRDFVENNKIYKMPTYLKNGSLKSDSVKKNKTQYLYPHDFKNDWIKQQYLPNEIKDAIFYRPNIYSKYEKQIDEFWRKIKNDE